MDERGSAGAQRELQLSASGDGIENRMVAFETEAAKLDRLQQTWVAHQQKPAETVFSV